ncbi:MAG: Mur ligase domain-containing protein [Saprospiraceae bacterium]
MKEISDDQSDSRKVSPGTLFYATKGTQADGHQFIDIAVDKGATAIVCEVFPKEIREGNNPDIRVGDTKEALDQERQYGNSSRQLKVVGITGQMVKLPALPPFVSVIYRLGYKCGLLSTIENKIGEEVIPSTHTTPDAISLNALLAEMVTRGCEFAYGG